MRTGVNDQVSERIVCFASATGTCLYRQLTSNSIQAAIVWSSVCACCQPFASRPNSDHTPALTNLVCLNCTNYVNGYEYHAPTVEMYVVQAVMHTKLPAPTHQDAWLGASRPNFPTWTLCILLINSAINDHEYMCEYAISTYPSFVTIFSLSSKVRNCFSPPAWVHVNICIVEALSQMDIRAQLKLVFQRIPVVGASKARKLTHRRLRIAWLPMYNAFSILKNRLSFVLRYGCTRRHFIFCKILF